MHSVCNCPPSILGLNTPHSLTRQQLFVLSHALAIQAAAGSLRHPFVSSGHACSTLARSCTHCLSSWQVCMHSCIHVRQVELIVSCIACTHGMCCSMLVAFWHCNCRRHQALHGSHVLDAILPRCVACSDAYCRHRLLLRPASLAS